MSRSIRHTPIIGNTTCKSEKRDKRIANRKLRRLVKEEIKMDKELSFIREVSSVWTFGKDGKHYIKNPENKWLRK